MFSFWQWHCLVKERKHYHVAFEFGFIVVHGGVNKHSRTESSTFPKTFERPPFTPTSAKISTNQWYYFLSFISQLVQTKRTQNFSNTNFSQLTVHFCSQSWLRPVGRYDRRLTVAFRSKLLIFVYMYKQMFSFLGLSRCVLTRVLLGLWIFHGPLRGS